MSKKIWWQKTNAGPRRRNAYGRYRNCTKNTRKKTKFRQQPFLAICTRVMPYWVRKLKNYMEKKYIMEGHEKLLLFGKNSSRDVLTSDSRQDVNQDSSRINSAGLPCKCGTWSGPAFAPAGSPAFFCWCSELIFVQSSSKITYLVIFSCFLLKYFVYKCMTIQEKILQPVSNRFLNRRYTDGRFPTHSQIIDMQKLISID